LKSCISSAASIRPLGRPLDGNDDNQPGGDYTATFSRNGVTADGLSLARTPRKRLTIPVAIDALLVRGELAELVCPSASLRERRAR
jgi:hypothetical protein